MLDIRWYGCAAPNVVDEDLHWHAELGAQLNQLSRAFALSVYDNIKKQWILARDPLGVEPLFYSIGSQVFVSQSPAEILQKDSSIADDINESWLVEYLLGSCVYDEQTLYLKLKRVLPGHYVIIKNGQAASYRYTDLAEYRPIEYANESDYIEHFCELLQSVVADYTREASVIGCELSGGIDSTLVTAATQRVLSPSQQIKTFSHALTAEQQKTLAIKDESVYVNQVLQALSLRQHYSVLGQENDIQPMLTAIMHHGIPTMDYYTAFSDGLLARAKQQGVDVLLSGFGGDECVTSHVNVAPFELIKNHRYREFVHMEWPAGRSKLRTTGQFGRRLLRSLGYVYGQPCYRLKRRIKPKGFLVRRDHSLLSAYAIHTHRVPKVVRQFTPLSCLNQREMMVELLFGSASGYIHHRLECAALSAQYWGLRYRFPLLDQRLVSFCLNIPNRVRKRRGVKRYLARRAIARWTSLPFDYRLQKMGINIVSSIPRTRSLQVRPMIDAMDFTLLQPVLKCVDLSCLDAPQIRPAKRAQLLMLLACYSQNR